MKTVEKYDNLSETFPRLPTVLSDAIQNEFLAIKKINAECKHYQEACCDHPTLKDATCVIYSPFMKKCAHDYETFIFIDESGEETCHISGREMDLDGMIEPVNALRESEEYSKVKINVCA